VSDIFREIEEDIRRDNFAQLWVRYRVYVIALLAVLILGTAGFTGWREYQLRQRQTEGERFAAALDLVRDGKETEAADRFAALSSQAGGGHAVLATFELAALKARAGDTETAIALYNQISADTGTDQSYRDAATLLDARYALDKGDPQTVIDRLKPLTDAGSAFRASALEFTALAQLKSGDKTAARKTYQQLADDIAAPAGARQRATQMLAALGS
jgi:hypothetical protein